MSKLGTWHPAAGILAAVCAWPLGGCSTGILYQVNETLKEMQKEGEISEDEFHRAHDKTVQEMTDESVHEVDHILGVKEAELMEV